MRVCIKSLIGMRFDIKFWGHVALAERKVVPSLPIHSGGDRKLYYLQYITLVAGVSIDDGTLHYPLVFESSGGNRVASPRALYSIVKVVLGHIRSLKLNYQHRSESNNDPHVSKWLDSPLFCRAMKRMHLLAMTRTNGILKVQVDI
jgi:hypothetical protein